MKKQWEKMPIFLKAVEIDRLIQHLTKVVENTDIQFEKDIHLGMLEHHLDHLKRNSSIIPAKIAGAADEDGPYDLKMENAALIRKTARELLTDLRGLELYGYNNIEYLDLLRNEIDEFRILFARWVNTFDPWNYRIDRWGLFNPPGVHYDDHDPDDDIPLNSDE